MTSILPEGRFGKLDIDENNRIKAFTEKPKGDASTDNAGWINGGFFVCEPKIFDYIKDGDETIFEQEPLKNLAKDAELYSYKHNGFWKCMDTLKDKKELSKMWLSAKAPWALWED